MYILRLLYIATSVIVPSMSVCLFDPFHPSTSVCCCHPYRHIIVFRSYVLRTYVSYIVFFKPYLVFYIATKFWGMGQHHVLRWWEHYCSTRTIRCNTMQFLCAPATQLMDQPCTTLNSTISSGIHHQRPQPIDFSHIGWSELLPTNYKARKTSFVSCEHNSKTKRCLAHLCLLLKSTRLSRRWIGPGVSSCFSHLGWTKPKKKKKGYGVPNWHY
jgi:hypothetical protein